jgi:hypothetical protein
LRSDGAGAAGVCAIVGEAGCGFAAGIDGFARGVDSGRSIVSPGSRGAAGFGAVDAGLWYGICGDCDIGGRPASTNDSCVRSTDAIGAGTSDCLVTGGLVPATFGVAGEDGSGGRAKSDRTSCACGGVGAIGFGASGCGTSGLGASGFGASGFGTSGFGASGFGTSGFGVSGFGTSGFGVSGFGTSDRGASGFVVVAIASGLTSTERARSKSTRGMGEGVAVSGRSREASSGRVSGVVLAPCVVSTFAGGGD